MEAAIQAGIQAANQAAMEGQIVKHYHCNHCNKSCHNYNSLESHRQHHLRKKKALLLFRCELPRIWIQGGRWEKCGCIL
ncbi:hypothetical protein FRX31_009203 [Thalictrum thalictroides]|uniref:C2H2-type domain-containing protein n=1 Tax=Thalictrum thalictroides TaxID=46969 RepID=A0A7J6WXH6_THATH|nr:hypothetical protein FRX31_009203 [Thalictrum thalictroides]